MRIYFLVYLFSYLLISKSFSLFHFFHLVLFYNLISISFNLYCICLVYKYTYITFKFLNILVSVSFHNSYCSSLSHSSSPSFTSSQFPPFSDLFRPSISPTSQSPVNFDLYQFGGRFHQLIIPEDFFASWPGLNRRERTIH